MTTEGADPAARPAVPRARDAEPDRVRGHVPAARGAARPLPAADRASATRTATTSSAMLEQRRERRTDDVELRPVVDGETLRRDAAGARGRPRRAERRLLHRRRRPRDAREPQRPGRREPARERSRSSSSPGPTRCSTAATSSFRTTSRRSPARRSRTGSRSGPSSGCSACGRRTSSQEQLETVPTPAGRGRPPGRVTRAASPKLAAYAALGGLGAARRARHAAGPSSPRSRCRSCAYSGPRSSSPPIRRSRSRACSSATGCSRATRSESSSRLSAKHAVQRAEVLLVLPPALALVDGRNPTATYASARKPRDARPAPAARALGRVRPPRRPRPRARLLRHVRLDEPCPGSVPGHVPSRSIRGRRRCAHLLRPAETQLFSGDELSRRKGEGIEFADLRPFAFGDRMRRINWRASARRGELWVNEQHPERNTDVVLFLDSFAEARRGAARDARPAVRAAADARRAVPPAARPGRPRLLRRLRSAGSRPGSGRDAALPHRRRAARHGDPLSYAWKAIDIVPARTLPPQALVIALTPLLDERAVARAARPARPRVRPRGRRGVAAAVRRPGPRASRATARLPALEAPARGAARASTPPRACRSRSGGTASRSRRRSRR